MTTKKKTASNKPLDSRVFELAVSKLDSSGLDIDDAKLLGIDILTGEESVSIAPSHGPLSALKLNYYDPISGEPIGDWPKSPPYWRLRYLETVNGFASLTKAKPLRYVQPFGTAPVAYFPKNMDWSCVLPDPEVPLIITEGELKSAKACKEGFPTIGLGGVDSFQAKKMGVVWLDSLDIVEWVGRHVYICYDSDTRTNINVLSALERLASELEQRGAHSYVMSLPDLPGLEKTGLDDYLIHADGGPDQFEGLLKRAEPLGLSRALFNMNDRYIYVMNPGLIVNERTDSKISPGAFKEHVAAPSIYVSREFEIDGTIKTKTTSAASAWLKWPLRREVEKITYAPGCEKFIIDKRGLSVYNSWQGWGVEPKKGDVSLFTDLVDHIFEGAEPGAKEWFLKWCAYPLQYPGVKLFTDVLIHGRRHGTGKSLIGYTIGRIYGDNFTEINQQHLHANHNEWAENKQFILGDDVTGSNKREDADLLKKLITQREIRLNPKYIPSYTVPDVINYFFTSNHADAFFLEDDDRRHFIHEVKSSPMDEVFYVEYDLWLDSGGASAVFDYLLNYNIDDFNPAAHAFSTQAKQRMISDVQSDLGSWVRRLKTDTESVLMIGNVVIKKDLFTNRELLELYDVDRRTGTTANGLGREMKRAGFEMVNNGVPVRTALGTERLYAVRNRDAWMSAKLEQIVKYVESESNTRKKSKY